MPQSNRLRALAISGVIVIMAMICGILAILALLGHDVSGQIPTVAGFALPVVTSLLTFAGLSNELGEIKAQVKNDVTQVAEQLSTTTDELTSSISDLDTSLRTGPISIVERPRLESVKPLWK